MEKHIAFTFQATAAQPAGTFAAIVCTFDTPMKSGLVVKKGAFTQSLRAWRTRDARIPVVYSHQREDPLAIIGEIDPVDLEETARGLVVHKGQLYMAEERPRKVFEQLKRKTLEWSFSAAIERERDRDGTRELLQLALIEVGPCLAGDGKTETLLVASAEPISVTALRQQLVAAQLAQPRARLDLICRRIALARALSFMR